MLMKLVLWFFDWLVFVGFFFFSFETTVFLLLFFTYKSN